MNPLLDPYPDEYEGYLIRTDYRIGVQIALAADDPELTEYERTSVCLGLLYGNGWPDITTALNGFKWFLCAGRPEEKGGGRVLFSYEHDAPRIQSAFMRAYQIDLHRAKMHWFEFCALMADLPDCGFTKVLEIRGQDLSKIPSKERSAWEKLKRKYALPATYTSEEQGVISDFWARLKD